MLCEEKYWLGFCCFKSDAKQYGQVGFVASTVSISYHGVCRPSRAVGRTVNIFFLF